VVEVLPVCAEAGNICGPAVSFVFVPNTLFDGALAGTAGVVKGLALVVGSCLGGLPIQPVKDTRAMTHTSNKSTFIMLLSV
jgi:hypothetical protein